MNLLCYLGIHKWAYREEQYDMIDTIKLVTLARCLRDCERYGPEQVVHVDIMIRGK
jgi:hypothetical protein